MKKLKIQTAVLAISLALATILPTSKEINAMKTNELLIEQNFNYNGPKETTNLEKTFSQQLKEFIEALHKKNIDINNLGYKDYIEPLSNYIGNNIIKHLALMIQANYDQIPKITTLNGTQESIAPTLYGILKKDPLKTLGKPDLTNKPDIKTDRSTNKQKAKIHQYLRYIRKKGAGRTNEEEILNLLANAHEDRTTNDLLTQLSKTISNYIIDKETTADESYSQLIILLGPVADQLDRENFYQNPDNKDTPLGQLAKLVRQFKDAYVTKLNTQQQQEQQLRKIIANASTHTQALQLYVDSYNIQQLGKEQYQKFVKYYINDNLVKYLALLIQAAYNLITFPTNMDRDNSITSVDIYYLIACNMYNQRIPYALMGMDAIIDAIEETFFKLNKSQPQKPPTPNNFTEAELILISLLCIEQQPKDDKEKINLLKQSIENYKTKIHLEYGSLYDNYLSLLGDIATQLQKEAAYNNSPEKEQLQELATQIQSFSSAYKAPQVILENLKWTTEMLSTITNILLR